MICKNCGAEIEDNSTICQNCGLVVQENNEDKTTFIEKIKDKKKLIIPIAIVAAVVVFVAGLGIGGAFSKNDAEPMGALNEEEMGESVAEQVIEPQENRVYIKAKQSDIDMLTGRLWNWIYNNQGTFDSSTRSMKDVLQKDIFDEFTATGLYDVYFGEESQQLPTYINSTNANDSFAVSEKDPLNKFDEGCHYRKVPSKNVDWVIANVLNVIPDKDFDSNYIYYKDGYYYVQIPEAGDGRVRTQVTLTELSDGRYNIRFDVETGETIDMLAGVTEIEGKRIWSFFKF